MAAKKFQDADAGELGLDSFKSKPGQEGLSLDQLNQAFAEMLGRGDDPYGGDAPQGADPFAPAEPDEPGELSPLSILEALLFVGNSNNEPLTSRQVAEMMRGVSPAEIEQLVRELNARYAADHCPYHVASQGAGYRLLLRQPFDAVRDKFYGRSRQATLSQAAIEVLALVAYGQPIAADEVSQRRGTASGAILTQLVRRQLLRMERDEGEKPRRARYYTTDRFLQLLGLGSLDDLPQSQDLDGQ